MTDTIYNTCVICGKETNMRCQPCGKAGVEVFFCGAAHQREIWPVHKFFCGPNACPLIWPDLTKAEADSAWENRHLKKKRRRRRTRSSSCSERWRSRSGICGMHC
ncbi:hypothetical protein NBRC10513_006379 [Rhodotorula toruloides]